MDTKEIEKIHQEAIISYTGKEGLDYYQYLIQAGYDARDKELQVSDDEMWSKIAQDLCYENSCTEHNKNCFSNKDINCDYIKKVKAIKERVTPVIASLKQEIERLNSEFQIALKEQAESRDAQLKRFVLKSDSEKAVQDAVDKLTDDEITELAIKRGLIVI
jgi:hypothetical protein